MGWAFDTTSKFVSASVYKSRSCTTTPPKTDVTSNFCGTVVVNDTVNKRKFFLADKISKASGVKLGAIMISKKIACIFSAVAASTSRFKATIPPKMDTSSAANALSQASSKVDPCPIPAGFMCFTVTTVVSSNSAIMRKAASASRMLLYDNCLPCKMLAFSTE